jgi:RNA polymerase sigma factor (sigma-70 family)
MSMVATLGIEDCLPHFRRFAARLPLSQSDRDDLVQDATVSAMRSIENFDPDKGNLAGWCQRIVKLRYIDRARALSRHLPPAPADEHDDPRATLDHDPHALADAARLIYLRLLAAGIRPRQARWTVLVKLADEQGWSYEEAGPMVARAGLSEALDFKKPPCPRTIYTHRQHAGNLETVEKAKTFTRLLQDVVGLLQSETRDSVR